MRISRYLFTGLVAIAFAGNAPAQVRSFTSKCIGEGKQLLGELTWQRCTMRADPTWAPGDIASYYGRALISVQASTSIRDGRSVGRAMAHDLLRIGHDYTGMVSIAVSQGGVPIFERPLFFVDVQMGRNRPATFKTQDIFLDNAPVTPWIALKTDSPITVKLKVSTLKERQSEIPAALASGFTAFSAFGGSDWLLSTITSESFQLAGSRLESAYNNAINQRTSLGTEAQLQFANNPTNRVEYLIELPQKSGTTSIFVSAHLEVRHSLITTQLKKEGYPDTLKGTDPASPWASRIIVGGANPKLTLDQYLTTKGVPVLLTELKVASSDQGNAVPRLTLVNNACIALKEALEGEPVQLSTADHDLILYDELRTGGILDTYPADTLSCLNSVRENWTQRYGLPIPNPNQPKPVPSEARLARLKLVAEHWGDDTAERRSKAMSNDFRTLVVRGPRQLFPSLANTGEVDEPNDAVSGQMNHRGLAELRATCLVKLKGDDNGAWQTALVRFEGRAGLYLLTAYFDGARRWGDEGPPIREMAFRLVSDQDGVDAGAQASCAA